MKGSTHSIRYGYGLEMFFSELDRLLVKSSSDDLHVDVVYRDLSKAFDMPCRS